MRAVKWIVTKDHLLIHVNSNKKHEQLFSVGEASFPTKNSFILSCTGQMNIFTNNASAGWTKLNEVYSPVAYVRPSPLAENHNWFPDKGDGYGFVNTHDDNSTLSFIIPKEREKKDKYNNSELFQTTFFADQGEIKDVLENDTKTVVLNRQCLNEMNKRNIETFEDDPSLYPDTPELEVEEDDLGIDWGDK